MACKYLELGEFGPAKFFFDSDPFDETVASLAAEKRVSVPELLQRAIKSYEEAQTNIPPVTQTGPECEIGFSPSPLEDD